MNANIRFLGTFVAPVTQRVEKYAEDDETFTVDRACLRLPHRLRTVAGDREYFVTSYDGHRVQAYPMPLWLEFERRLAQVPSDNPARIKFLDRVNFFGTTTEAGSGEIEFAPLLASSAMLSHNAFIVATEDGYFEAYSLDSLNESVRRSKQNPGNNLSLLARLLGLPLESQAGLLIGAIDDAKQQASVRQLFQEIIKEATALIAARPDRVFEISDRHFEYVIAEIVESFGFDVELTARTRDGGADIIAVRRTVHGTLERHVIECKRWARTRKVSVGLVRALYGVKAASNSDRAVFVTTAGFTHDAWRLATEGRILDLELVDFERLTEWFEEYLRNIDKSEPTSSCSSE